MGQTEMWKVLEDFMIAVRRGGAVIPPSLIGDLRNAKLMIKISELEGSKGDSFMKVDEFLGNVESKLIVEAQKVLSQKDIDEWLRRIDEANVQCETCKVSVKKEENKFVVGVPRDQKWIRAEPSGDLTVEQVRQIAKESNVSVNLQRDGRLVVFGQPEGIKDFLKRTTELVKKTVF